ncbi:hypothetical protein CHQ84_02200 [Francisella noatunensis subsp. orientalis]|uniref:Uncharacterized protein n=1 Tax=Francisella orientalis TaxID=299583 RepID=A0AAW9YNX4_9GAMM|nr:tryptophan-rich sensory protein [Francisella orientalis]MBK2012951.1 tryptophan-rich sensory protein [Francisella orientalis]MBK2021956.1 tryptophan-rich sensory protein [Francisella orientalis]MBK2047665.1 tryptophan-rich sensory protein [Francisella orientalis]MBK2073874.1 tryptophan-rich sensory protein [Francisella orientalis]
MEQGAFVFPPSLHGTFPHRFGRHGYSGLWLICLAYRKIKVVSLQMIPYLSWILFTAYLNFYIWWCN